MSKKSDPQSPFVDDYLAALLALSSLLISKEFHGVVRKNGFSVNEWRILATLTDNPGLSISQLALISVSKQPTVTRLLDRMVEKGLVEKSGHDSDRRITRVAITPQGREIISKLIVLAKEHERRVLEPLGRARAEELKNTLRKIVRDHSPSTLG